MKRKTVLSVSLICILALLLSLFSACSEKPAENNKENEKPVIKESEFAAENLFDFASSKIKSDSGEKLTVGIIGGTETAGNIVYDYEGDPFDYNSNPILEGLCYFFRELFPKRSLKVYDMAKENCGIIYGAAMFDRMMLQYSPDIIFITTTLGDIDTSEEDYTEAIESIITRAASAEKVPVICIVSMPSASPENSEKNLKWQAAVDREKKIAEKYGIARIDVMSAFHGYAGENDFATFLSDIISLTDIYSSLGCYYTYDSVKQFILTKPAEFFKKIDRVESSAKYNTLNVRDSRLVYDGNWNFWDYKHPYDPSIDVSLSYTNALKMSDSEWLFPLWPDGVADGRSPSESVTLKTDADKLYLTFRSIRNTASVTVFVDGEAIGVLNTLAGSKRVTEFDASANVYINSAPESNKSNVAYIKLPGDGQQHEVKLVVGECNGTTVITFQLGYIIEYKK